MGTDGKASHTRDQIWGKAKEVVGRMAGDEELEAQGKGDQAKGDFKQAAEKVKDAFKH